MTRREFAGYCASLAALTSPLRAIAAAAKPVRIRNVNIFPIEIAISRDELEMGKYARYTSKWKPTRGCAATASTAEASARC
jgi:hypothetical protein